MIIHKNINLKNYNTLRINYFAKLMFEVTTAEEIYILILIFNELKIDYFVIGNGSKILFAKEDIYKPIIYINKSFSELYYHNDCVMVSSGYLLSKLIIELSKTNYGGFEKLYPIPASIGGLIFMNGGIKEYDISNFVRYVLLLNKEGKLILLDNKKCGFSYRNSIFKNEKYIILYAILNVYKIDKKIILENINLALKYRKENQLFDKNTIGSLFKNDNNVKAYELISSSITLPINVNGASIEKKHANFLICENATNDDVLKLIELIRHKVYDKYKYLLELELNILN